MITEEEKTEMRNENLHIFIMKIRNSKETKENQNGKVTLRSGRKSIKKKKKRKLNFFKFAWE